MPLRTVHSVPVPRCTENLNPPVCSAPSAPHLQHTLHTVPHVPLHTASGVPMPQPQLQNQPHTSALHWMCQPPNLLRS